VISAKPDNCVPLFTKSNERLEFMGDGILECITKYLYKRFPKENEGFMTEENSPRQKRVDRQDGVRDGAAQLVYHIQIRRDEADPVNFKNWGVCSRRFWEPCFWISIR
jgi:hypothetical protein